MKMWDAKASGENMEITKKRFPFSCCRGYEMSHSRKFNPLRETYSEGKVRILVSIVYSSDKRAALDTELFLDELAQGAILPGS